MISRGNILQEPQLGNIRIPKMIFKDSFLDIDLGF